MILTNISKEVYVDFDDINIFSHFLYDDCFYIKFSQFEAYDYENGCVDDFDLTTQVREVKIEEIKYSYAD
jgi:hypothetical protein